MFHQYDTTPFKDIKAHIELFVDTYVEEKVDAETPYTVNFGCIDRFDAFNYCHGKYTINRVADMMMARLKMHGYKVSNIDYLGKHIIYSFTVSK